MALRNRAIAALLTSLSMLVFIPTFTASALDYSKPNKPYTLHSPYTLNPNPVVKEHRRGKAESGQICAVRPGNAFSAALVPSSGALARRRLPVRKCGEFPGRGPF